MQTPAADAWQRLRQAAVRLLAWARADPIFAVCIVVIIVMGIVVTLTG